MRDIDILKLKNVTKEFPGVKALDRVNISIKKGEIHFLCGENGAGKSTLMKIVSGVYSSNYTGEIILNGTVEKFKNISESKEKGIAIIYQELALIPEMSIYENIFIGNEHKKGLYIDFNRQIKESKELLKKVGLNVNVAEKVKNLGIGKQQLVEIAKALSDKVDVLILDEPTAALNEDDSENLLKLIKNLQKNGVTCIMISHKLKEVTAIADTVTVIRDGKNICTLRGNEIKEEVIIKNMVGRQIDNIYPKRNEKKIGSIALSVENFNVKTSGSKKEVLKNINFNVKKGEIIGISGLMGAGRTELALAIFGNTPKYKIDGTIKIGEEVVQLKTTKDAIAKGIAYVTEDRKGNGLILDQDIKTNITLANLKKISKNGFVNKNDEVSIAEYYKNSLTIKTNSIEQKTVSLSGGNQQKVSLAKWLNTNPKILILDEPTRGIDVGAKFEIYTLMNELVAQGMSIIMISSELLEIVGMSDRVYVLSEGEIKGELKGDEIAEETIISLSVKG